MEYQIVKWLTPWVLPPGLNLALLLAALLARRWRMVSRLLVVVSLFSLLLLSLPFTARALSQAIEIHAALDPESLEGKGAIVVLGGGRYRAAPEYGGEDTVSRYTLERVRYAAHVARASGWPVLTSGGNPLGDIESEAEVMARVMESEWGVAVRWREERSANTAENARYSRDLLKAAGINRVVVVTHAWHMQRAMRAFEGVGLEAIAAPTKLATPPIDGWRFLEYLPSAGALHSSAKSLHEFIGLLWYWLRYS